MSIPTRTDGSLLRHNFSQCTDAGFPRIGDQRQLKFAMEGFFKGDSTEAELLAVAHNVQADAWALQKAAGISLIGLDGTLYDQVLDTITWLGAIPPRFQASTWLRAWNRAWNSVRLPGGPHTAALQPEPAATPSPRTHRLCRACSATTQWPAAAPPST